MRSDPRSSNGPRVIRLAVTSASALLLVLSQSPFDFGAVAMFALAPWLVVVRRALPRHAFLLGIAFGLIYGLVGSPWLASAFEAQGTGRFRSWFAALLVVLWAKGLSFGAMGMLVRGLRNLAPWLQTLVVGGCFGLAQSWMSGSRWGLPVMLMGHSQLSVPGVAQLAGALGVPGISALLFASNSALAMVCERRGGSRPVLVATIATWATLASFGLPLATWMRPSVAALPDDPPGTANGVRLLVVQPYGPRERRWKPEFQRVVLDEVAAHTSHALQDTTYRPDLILWPENLLTSPLRTHRELRRRFQTYVDEWGIPVVTGLVRYTSDSPAGLYRNSVVWWAPELGELDSVDKARAIPLVESSRGFWGRSTLARVIGGAAEGPKVEESDIARPLTGDFTLSPALCFEALFPRIVADRRNAKSVAIVNLADDSWVPGELADRQLIVATAFRAIEQRLILIRVSHGGLSVVIDPFGREIASLPSDRYAHHLVRASPMPAPTPLEQIAIVTIPAGIGLLAWVFARAIDLRQRAHPND